MSPKNYGRQAEGKTIKSLSLDKEVVEWIEEEAKRQGVSFSKFMNDYLKEIFAKKTPFDEARAKIMEPREGTESKKQA